MKRDKAIQMKVIIRGLPSTMTEEQFVEQFSPLPEHDYMYFVKADTRLGKHAFSRAYLNFVIPEDVYLFKDKFDGYVILDSKGDEYPALVEFAPFQKIPKKRNPKKRDNKCGTIFNDSDYLKFLESHKKPDEVILPSTEVYLEEIETREKELKANKGVLKMTTPLIEFIKAKKIEQQEWREEQKRKEMERRRIREEERRKRKAARDIELAKERLKKESLSEKEASDEHEESTVSDNIEQLDPVVRVLKNPEREKDQKEVAISSPKNKDNFVPSRLNKDKNKKEWERIHPKDRQKGPVRGYLYGKDKSHRDKADYKLYNKKKPESEASSRKQKDENVKDSDIVEKEPSNTIELSKEGDIEKTACSQWSSKDKRDSSCPGNVETLNSQKDKNKPTSKQYKHSSKSVTGENTSDINELSKSDSSSIDNREKDPRVERRIRNKDRPTLEIYRPGMRRFSTQRSSQQKEISTSASNSSSPSPTPPLATVTVKAEDTNENPS